MLCYVSPVNPTSLTAEKIQFRHQSCRNSHQSPESSQPLFSAETQDAFSPLQILNLFIMPDWFHLHTSSYIIFIHNLHTSSSIFIHLHRSSSSIFIHLHSSSSIFTGTICVTSKCNLKKEAKPWPWKFQDSWHTTAFNTTQKHPENTQKTNTFKN